MNFHIRKLKQDFIFIKTTANYAIPLYTQRVIHGTYTVNHTIILNGDLVVE